MLTKKEAAIVDVLLQHQTSYLSSQKIAAAIGMSDRTIRKYLGLIEDKIGRHGAVLTSKSGYGYLLSFTDEEAFQLYWQEVQKADRFIKEVTQLEESIDRRHYIIHKLFLEDDCPTISDLSQELYLSKTSIAQLLHDIKDLVLPYGIKVQTGRKGIRIVGKEGAIRHFIKDYFFLDSFQQSVFSLIHDELLEESHFSEIIMVVIDECRNAQLHLPDFILHNLVVHLALMIRRIHLGKEIKIVSGEQLGDSREYQVAQRMLHRLSESFALVFPEKEAEYISIHLHRGSIKDTEEQEIPQKTDDLATQLTHQLEELGQELQVPLQTDGHLLESLKAHFVPLVHRLDNHIQLLNPLKEDIIRQYPLVFEAVKQHFSRMPLLQHHQITDDEYAYISLHILASLEKMSTQNHHRVLVVCASGYGSARMLQSRLEKEFPQELEIVEVASYLDLSEHKLKGIDFIISSVDLGNLVFLVPVVRVNVLLQSRDIARIRAHMAKKAWTSSDSGLVHTSEPRQNQQSLDITQLFQEHQFLYFDKAVDKETILSEMIQRLDEAENQPFQLDFRKQIAVRENLSSIVYDEVLAFPHPAKALSLMEQVVVAICQEPVKWDKEHEKVQFIFLLSPSKGKNERMKVLTPALVSFVHCPELHKELLSKPTLENFITVVRPLL
ncbi:BglG family transcription antiterminator [Streptococcus marmotae]|uniref:BglG family transcription antiterminator n=1 Tax=Streptococcus marmotae TaxID=1825069 RepID=UPI0008357877|nr:PRD domain-containing protein [Streptococcus marmotae]